MLSLINEKILFIKIKKNKKLNSVTTHIMLTLFTEPPLWLVFLRLPWVSRSGDLEEH
jgi:hypothetical protein